MSLGAKFIKYFLSDPPFQHQGLSSSVSTGSTRGSKVPPLQRRAMESPIEFLVDRHPVDSRTRLCCLIPISATTPFADYRDEPDEPLPLLALKNDVPASKATRCLPISALQRARMSLCQLVIPEMLLGHPHLSAIAIHFISRTKY